MIKKLFRPLLRPVQNLKLSVQGKLVAGFMTVMLLFIAMAALAIISLISYQSDLQASRNLDGTALVARDMRSTLRAEALAFSDLLLRQEVFFEEYYQVQNKELQEVQIPALLKAQLLDDEQRQLDAVIGQTKRLSDLFTQGIALTKAGNFDKATTLWNTQIKPQIEVAVSRVSLLADSLYDRANHNAQKADGSLAERLQWIFIALGIAIVLGVIVARTTTKAIVNQNTRLQTTLLNLQAAHQDIEERQEISGKVSRKVLALATELKTTASQQASGSQEQVAVVVQVNNAVSELSLTAANITEMAGQVNTAINNMAADSQQIEQTANLAVSQSEKGREAVGRTVTSCQALAQLYQQLLDTVIELNAKNADMQRILELLGTLSSETHLLALNAAIEAAGAGVYGERFGVVAQEVKNLAGRSSAASNEVVQIIQEVASTITSAMSTAQDGYHKALELNEAAAQSGEVIDEMRQISQKSQVQTGSISQAAHQVRGLTEVIRTATYQQQTASEQVLTALSGLSVVAQQNAVGSGLVSSSAVNLEQVSYDLNNVLKTA